MQALDLTLRWLVESVNLSATDGRIDFVVACDAKRLVWPNCSTADQPVYDRSTM